MEGKAPEVVLSALVPGETLEPLVMAAPKLNNSLADSHTSGVDSTGKIFCGMMGQGDANEDA